MSIPSRLARLLAPGLLVLTLAACDGGAPQPPTPTASVPDAARSTVTVSKAVGVRAGNKEQVDVTVTVLTAAGVPVAGRAVTVSAEGATVVQPAGPTDAQGVAVARVSSQDVGTRTVSVSVADEAGAVALQARPTIQFIVLSASKLAFPVPLSSVRAGEALAAFDVLVQDAAGETVAGASQPVTLSLGSAPAGAELKGTVTASAVNGVAHFTGLVLERASQGYTLLAHADGLTSATSGAFDVDAGDVASLALDPYPEAIVAGVQVDLAVSALDAYGNRATGYRGTVTFSASAGQNVLPGDHTFTAEDAGRFFMKGGLALSRAGGRTVTVVDVDRPELTDTEGVTVLAARAWKLAVTGVPAGGLTARRSVLVTAAYLDAYDNHVTDAGPDVTLALAKGELDGTTTAHTTDGLAQFLVSVPQQGTGYVLTASAEGLQPGSSAPFTVTDLDAPSVPVLRQTAGSPDSVTVAWTAPGDDGDLGTASSYDLRWSTQPITTELEFVAANVALVGAPQPAGSLEAVKLTQLPLHSTLYVALKVGDDAGHAVRTPSTAVATTYPEARRLVFTLAPSEGRAGVALTRIQVEVQDDGGFRAETASVPVTLSVPGVDGFTPVTVVAQSGVATFDGVRVDEAGVFFHFEATSPGLMAGASAPFSIQPNGAVRLVLGGLAAETTAGASFAAQVTAYDAYDNVATGFQGTVTLSSSDPRATLPPPYTFTAEDAGRHGFGVTLVSAGDQTLTVSVPFFEDVTGSTRVGSAEPASYALTLPTSATAGAAVQAKLEVRDGYGNRASGYRGTVRFTSTDTQALLPAQYAFTEADAGLHTFDVTFKTSGDRQLTVADTQVATLGRMTTVGVKWGPFDWVHSDVPATAKAGQPFTFKVWARDAYDNVVEDYAGTVHFSANDPGATLPADYTFSPADRGVHQFSATLVRAGVSSIDVFDVAHGVGYGPNTTVSPADAATFAVVSSAGPYVAGTMFNIEVRALDAYDNLATGYGGTVHLTSDDPRAELSADDALTQGVGTFQVTFETSGTHWLDAYDVANSAISRSVPYAVSPAAAHQLAFVAQPTGRSVRQTFEPVTVRLTDDYGNIVPASSPNVAVALVNGNTQAKLLGTASVAPVDGVATFTTLSVDQQGTGFQLRASGTDLTQADSSTFTVKDDVPPQTPVLTVASKTSVEVKLSWTAPGDDGLLGQGSGFQVRYDTSPITEQSFVTYQGRGGAGSSAMPGTQQSVPLVGLAPSTTYYFGIKVVDDVGNAAYAFTSTTTNADPCASVTCASDAPVCGADGRSLVTSAGYCADVGGAATCGQRTTTTACPGADAVCSEGACTTAPRAAAGQLSITEVMHDPKAGTTEYVELTNLTDQLLDLSGLTLSYADGSPVWSTTLGANGVPVLLAPRDTFVLAQNATYASNGGVVADAAYGTDKQLGSTGVLALQRGTTLLHSRTYTAQFPQASGYALELSNLITGTDAEQYPWYWCVSQTQLAGGSYGSPGSQNGACGMTPHPTLNWCNTYPGALPGSLPAGSTATARSQVSGDGISYRSTNGNDFYPHLEAQLGVGTTYDSAGWTWTAAKFDPDFHVEGAGQDELVAPFRVDAPGSYVYGFRYRTRNPFDGSTSAWTYCDQDGKAGTYSTRWGIVGATSSVQATHVVISELAPQGSGGKWDQFVELYNPTGADVSLEGWKLQYRGPGEASFTQTWALTGTIPAHGFSLQTVSGASQASWADIVYGLLLMTYSEGGVVRLVGPGAGTGAFDPATVDAVAWGNAGTSGEGGTPITATPALQGSYERKAFSTSTSTTMDAGGSDSLRGNGFDGDDTARDFVLRPMRGGQNRTQLETP